MFITILETVVGVCALIAGAVFAVNQVVNAIQALRKKERS